MEDNQSLYILAIAIISTLSSIISILAFIDNSGFIYKLMTRKKKISDNYIFMRDIKNDDK